jgi:chromosome segregation ATPase
MSHIWGTANSKTIRSLARRQIRVLVGIGVAFIGMNSVLVGPALPFESEPAPDAGIAAPSGGQVGARGEDRLTALAELTRDLATAKNRLEELARLTKELRDSRDSAITQAEDRRKALEQVTSISHALGEQLADEREEARETKAAMAAQLENLQSAEAEVASLRGKLKDSEARLADVSEKHARAEAKLVALEDRSSEAEQQITDLKAETSAVNQQLKAKDEALEGLASLRTERDELRQRLAEIQVSLKRKEEDNDRLSAELAAFRTAAETATTLARQHLSTLEGEIRALNEAAGVSQPEPEALREPQAESGSTATSDLTDLGAPSASSAEGVGDPSSSTKGRTSGYQLITPAQAEEKGSDSSLPIGLTDNLTKQREQLRAWLKELDDHSKGAGR